MAVFILNHLPFTFGKLDRPNELIFSGGLACDTLLHGDWALHEIILSSHFPCVVQALKQQLWSFSESASFSQVFVPCYLSTCCLYHLTVGEYNNLPSDGKSLSVLYPSGDDRGTLKDYANFGRVNVFSLHKSARGFLTPRLQMPCLISDYLLERKWKVVVGSLTSLINVMK